MKSSIKLSKRGSATPKSKHNVPLIESILLSFTIFLSCGLLLMMAVNFVRDHHPTFPVRTSSLDDGSWEHVHYHGEIKVTKKNDMLPYSMFRYQYKTELPFESLVDILSDPVQATEWFAWKVTGTNDEGGCEQEGNESEEENRNLNTCSVQMKVPYLQRHKREFLLHLSNEIVTMAQDDGGGGQVRQATFNYESDEDEVVDVFVCKDCKRGELNMNLTLTTDEFDALKNTGTDIEMKLYMNFHSKRIPTFLLNNISMQWGSISLLKLTKMCRNSLGLDDVMDTKMSLYNIFPIKR